MYVVVSRLPTYEGGITYYAAYYNDRDHLRCLTRTQDALIWESILHVALGWFSRQLHPHNPPPPFAHTFCSQLILVGDDFLLI